MCINRLGRESRQEKVRSRGEPAQEPAIQRESRGKDGQSRGNGVSEDLMLGPFNCVQVAGVTQCGWSQGRMEPDETAVAGRATTRRIF